MASNPPDPPRETEHEGGRVTDCEDGRVTDCEDGRVTDCEDGRVTDCEDGRVTQHESGRVTEREDGRVTQREVDVRSDRPTPGRVTQREATPGAAGSSPGAPALIADRYRVVATLSARGGEATVYRCQDPRRSAQDVAVKLYHAGRQPKDGALQPLLQLHSRHVVRLLECGQWQGQFYEVQEFCAGGSLLAGAPYSEDQLRQYLPQILAGLNECHRQNLIHRDLKPSNLLFRDAAKQEVVVADFGISSVLDDAEGLEGSERITQTRFKTLDYAAPELLGKQVVASAKGDYYALGITLAHLWQNCSPFHDYHEETIIAAHIGGDIPWPDALSPTFETLLQGLTQVDRANRWGYQQVGQWLRGEAILDDRGQPWRASSAIKGLSPYPGYPQARTPAELAAALDGYPQAQQDLFKGYIRQWVFLHDPALGRRIEKIEENDTQQPHLGLLKLKYLLDPDLPLKVGQHALYKLADLTRLLDGPDPETRKALDIALWDKRLEIWIDATQDPALAIEIAGLRQRLETMKQKALGVTVLGYLLDPQRPLRLLPAAPLKTLADQETVLAEHPGAEAALEEALFGGHLEEWLRAGQFPKWEEDTAFLRDCRHRHDQDRQLGVHALRWRWNPGVPLPLGRYRIGEPKDLAPCLDRDQAARDTAHTLLANGWLRAWLVASGRITDAEPLDRILNDSARSPGDKLEAFLHLCDPKLAWPTPVSSDARLNFGGISTESPQKTRQVTIRNGGRGYLAGTVRLRQPVEGLEVAPQRIEGHAVQVPVTVNCAGLRAGAEVQAELVVESNGGTLTLPIRFRVAVPWVGMVGRSLGVGLTAGLLLAGYRALVGGLFPAGHQRVLDWIPMDSNQLQHGFTSDAAAFGLFLLAGALVGGVVMILRYWRGTGRG